MKDVKARVLCITHIEEKEAGEMQTEDQAPR